MTTLINNKATIKTRGIAVLTGGVLAASALFHPTAAQADAKKDKSYKAGAAVLGVLGAYFILKGKTVPGAIAGAGAYYAYKKSKEAKNDDRYSDNYYSDNSNADDYYASRNDTYPDGSWSTPDANSSRTNDSENNNSGSSNDRYPDYNAVASSSKSSSSSSVVLK